MIVHDLNIFSACGSPSKTHAKLVVHANAVLTNTVALERFKSVSRWNAKVFKSACDLQLAQFASRY